MANADELSILYKEEVTFGVNPAGGSFETLRFTDESFRQETQTTSSRELRPDRQVPDVTRTNLSSAGGFSFEFSYGTFDILLAAAFFSTGWSSVVVTTKTDISSTAGSGDYIMATLGGDFVADGFLLNQWIRISGWTTTGTPNNGYAKITAISTSSMTVAQNGNGFTKIAGDSVEIEMGAQIVNGVSLSTFTFQREWTDLSNEFALNLGCAPAQLDFDVNADAIITGSLDFLGKIESSGTADATGGSPVAATTTSVMNAIDNVVAVIEGQGNAGAAIALTSFSASINNNLRARQQIASLGAISLGSGKIAVTGSFEGYFTTKAIVDKYLNFNTTGLSFKFLDTAGNAYVLEFPQVKLTAGPRNASGENTDILFNMNYTAYLHATELITARFVRWVV